MSLFFSHDYNFFFEVSVMQLIFRKIFFFLKKKPEYPNTQVVRIIAKSAKSAL